MKRLEKLKTFTKIGKSMIDEVRQSEELKESKSNLKKNIVQSKREEMPKTLIKDLKAVHDARKQAVKGILNSDEAEFIKMAIGESDKVKKVSETLENITDMIPEKIRIELINYKHWCLNWFYILKMGLSSPLPVIKGILKYSWIYDLIKANSMATAYVNKRSGANIKQIQMQISYIVKGICEMLQYTLENPDKVIVNENMVPSEIFQAMGLRNFVAELPGAILPKLDQYTGTRYLDKAEVSGLPVDTCGLPRFTTGVALLNEIPQGRCLIASNLPCDGGMASYEMIRQSINNVPIYRFNVPYDFRNDDSIDTFVEDLKGMIDFLEKNTGNKMDWDELRRICGNYNEMVDAELERWEMAMTENTPLANDAVWFPHYWNFNVTSGLDDSTKHYDKLLKICRDAYKKGEPAFPNMRYRAVMWNPPPSGYGHMWNWLERCWGIGVVMDLECYGHIEHIDTSTPDSMLRGLGRRYMWATMSKHTRGPAENIIGDLVTVIEDFKPDFVMYPAHIGCKNSMAMESTMKEVCQKMDIPFCVYRYELLDNRVTSRQQMREQVNKFMSDVMGAKPLDPSLLKIEDGGEDHW